MKALIYARFSTDRQNERSVDDQIAICAERCRREGWKVVGSYFDRAVSGSTPVAKRAGGSKLLAALMSGEADLLVIESLDRLSRDQVDQEMIVRQLEFIGVRIVGICDGYDSSTGSSRKVLRAVRGLVNELYLDDLRAKVKRGMRGTFARGGCAGGRVYGYRTESEDGVRRFTIFEPEAKVVRKIFERFADGWSVGRIVDDLNRKGIPSPRGGLWATSALVGVESLGTGMLNNPIYRGEVVFGRFEWRKDPTTGKRAKRLRPEAEWSRDHRPELRVIDEELWARVELRRRPLGRGMRKGPPSRTMLGGILRCGICGAPMASSGRNSYVCTARHNRGASVCPGTIVVRDAVEASVINLIQAKILEPGAVARIVGEVKSQLEAISKSGSSEREDLEARINVLQKEVDNLANGIANGAPADVLAPKIQERQARITEHQSELKALAAAEVIDVSDETLRKMVEARAEEIRSAIDDDVQVAREMLRQVLGPVTATETLEGLELKMKNPALGGAFGLPHAAGADIKMVAGEGFEPPTFGL